jgi:hypothetical protein
LGFSIVPTVRPLKGWWLPTSATASLISELTAAAIVPPLKMRKLPSAPPVIGLLEVRRTRILSK